MVNSTTGPLPRQTPSRPRPPLNPRRVTGWIPGPEFQPRSFVERVHAMHSPQRSATPANLTNPVLNRHQLNARHDHREASTRRAMDITNPMTPEPFAIPISGVVGGVRVAITPTRNSQNCGFAISNPTSAPQRISYAPRVSNNVRTQESKRQTLSTYAFGCLRLSSRKSRQPLPPPPSPHIKLNHPPIFASPHAYQMAAIAAEQTRIDREGGMPQSRTPGRPGYPRPCRRQQLEDTPEIRKAILLTADKDYELLKQWSADGIKRHPLRSVALKKALKDISVVWGEPEPCAICLETMKPLTLVKRLPCNHTYHDSCIANWLKQWAASAFD